jgi:hypothetical protein
MDVSTTFGTVWKETEVQSKTYTGGATYDDLQFATGPDEVAFVYLTDYNLNTGSAGGTVTFSAYNASQVKLKMPFSVTAGFGGGSVVQAYMAPGSIFLGPGEALHTTYSSTDAGGTCVVGFLIVKFSRSAKTK